MSKILAFAGSNNSQSINHQLVEFTAAQLPADEVTVLDIRAWEVPVYSVDMDPDQTPDQIKELIELIETHEGFILSSPEHNGGTPAFLKNILDWLSRRTKNVFAHKPIFLMSTSPGGGGAANNLKYLVNSIPYQGAEVAATFSLPSFYDNFQDGTISNKDYLGQFQESIGEFREALTEF